jgi:hypothetical protein
MNVGFHMSILEPHSLWYNIIGYKWPVLFRLPNGRVYESYMSLQFECVHSVSLLVPSIICSVWGRKGGVKCVAKTYLRSCWLQRTESARRNLKHGLESMDFCDIVPFVQQEMHNCSKLKVEDLLTVVFNSFPHILQVYIMSKGHYIVKVYYTWKETMAKGRL